MLKEVIEKYNVKLITAADIINELVEIAKEIKKQQDEGKKLDLTEEELAFYDMLLKSKGEVFKNENEIKQVAKEVVKRLGNYIKIVDWNKKETLRAKIKMAIKEILVKVVGERVEYKKIDRIASEIYGHIEELYAA